MKSSCCSVLVAVTGVCQLTSKRLVLEQRMAVITAKRDENEPARFLVQAG